ncbi:MAG: FkbM family methyltransferase [Cyanobium sp.]
MNAVITHADRFLKAARMGVLWNGTTRFTLPKRFKYNSIACSIVGPPEQSLAWVFRDLILDDEYGLTKLSQKPATVLDVGGNIGLFTLWAGVNFPQATIHVYEPNPALLHSLESNTQQVGATVFAEGVAGQDGTGTFIENGESMVGQCKVTPAGDIRLVSLRTAVERLGGSVDLLKLDCEGAEW